MGYVPVVENPRRRRGGGKKRRHYTAKQIAAGFGGKRHKSARKSRPSRRRRSSYSVAPVRNPRRRYHSAPVRRSRRHRNPSRSGGRGMLGGLIPSMSVVKTALYVGGGALSTRMVPNLIRKYLPTVGGYLPTDGIGGYLVKLGAGIGTAYVAGMVTKDSSVKNNIVIGAIAAVAVDIWNDYGAPQLGLSGLSGELAAYGDLRGVVEYPFARGGAASRRMACGEYGV